MRTWPSTCIAALTALALGTSIACSESRNLGSSAPHGLLPVDERNPIVLTNDGVYDNWQGEYAILLSNGGGPKLAGIAVGTSPNEPDVEKNMIGWRGLVEAARASGLAEIPDPTTSIGANLVRPTSGQIEATVPNRSEGARLIVELSKELSLPYRPLVVVTGGRLTDAADAYLVDPTVAERTVIVSSLGAATETGGAMANPNGEMDPWADFIVTSRFRFVQVSAFYDQLMDVPDARLSDLPDNPLGRWISAKQPEIWALPQAADQVALLSVAVPAFALEVERVSAAATLAADATAGPALLTRPDGAAWLVRRCDGSQAAARFWTALLAVPDFTPAP
jgi:hypothetical protein